jgi:hypothetical protein
MSIFPLSNSILLGSINTSGLVDNTMFTGKSTETTRQIFTPIIRTNNLDGGIKLGLNHAVKYLKNRGHLPFIF